MSDLAETSFMPRPGGQVASVNLRIDGRKFAHSSGDEPLPGYVIQRGLGIGGFGEVYYATSQAGKDVALKKIQRNHDVELRGVQQCLNLRHPNLVALYDIRYDQQANPWVVMEYVGGDSLRDVLVRNPTGLSDAVTLHWFRGIAAGVAYLHDNDVVHRDLKPGNIFLDNGIVKIGDYGLAKLISTSRGSGQTESVGTFHYMAPEIGQGRYGRRIDIYALGILLYEMVTGRVPFEGESSQEIIMKHLTADPSMELVPARYRSAISRALAKDPDRRCATVDSMLADLQLTPFFYEPASLTQPSTEIAVVSLDDTIVTAEAIPDPKTGSLDSEPIARGLNRVIGHLRNKWESANFNTPTKFVLLLISVLLLVLSSEWLVPTAFFLGTIYAGYLVIWMLLAPTAATRQGQRIATASTSNLPVMQTASQQYLDGNALSREIFRHRSWVVRGQELIGSMLLSTLVVGVLTVLMLVVASNEVGSFYSWAPTLAWMALTSVLGTWIILILGKFYEQREGDFVLRCFSLLVAGMFLGGISVSLAKWLVIQPTYLIAARSAFSSSPILYRANGSPQLLVGMVYFGSLFLLLRWWSQCDPLRQSRLSIVTTVGCVLTAILIHFVLPFPRGFLIAATMSMAIQISAPWLTMSQRKWLVDRGAPLNREA